MTNIVVFLPRVAALSVTLTVLASSMAGAQTPVSSAPAQASNPADSGDVNAMGDLARSYTNGQGVPRDSTQALAWHRKGADLGSARDMYILGLMYRDGNVVPQDDVEAHKWLSLATTVIGGHQTITAESRDRVAKLMTPAQIADAEQRAREWRSE